MVLIPAFSIGRTQELLYELEDIIHRSKTKKIRSDLAWDDLEIIVDSPLAAKFTEVYRTLTLLGQGGPAAPARGTPSPDI